MLRNEPRDLRGWMHDVEQRLLTLWLENARQWYDMPRAEPPVPPLWLGGPWKPAPNECPCPHCVNVSVDSPYAAGSPWNLQRSSCGSYYGTDSDGNSVVFQKYSSSGEARVTWTVVDSETGSSTGFNAHYVSDESTDTGNYDTWCTTGGTMVLSFSNAGDLDLDTYPLPATVTVTPATCSTSSGSGSGSSGSGSGSSGSGSGSSGSGSGSSGSGSSGSGSSGSGSGSSGSGSGSSGSGSGSSGSGSGSSGSGSGSSGSGSGSSGSGSGSSGSGSSGSGSGSSGSGSGSGGSGSGGSGSGGSGSGGSGSGGSGSGGSGSGSGTGEPCCDDSQSPSFHYWKMVAGADGNPVQGDNALPSTGSGTTDGAGFPQIYCGCTFFGDVSLVVGVPESPATAIGSKVDVSHLSEVAFNESYLLCNYNPSNFWTLGGQICYITYDGSSPPCDGIIWKWMETAMVVWRSWNIALAQYQYHTLFEFRLFGQPWVQPGCGNGPYKFVMAQYYKAGCPANGDVLDLIYQGTLAGVDICYFPDTAVLQQV